MFVVVVGGGKVGSHLSKTLAGDGHTVTLVEEDADRCESLAERLPGVTIVCGDGDEPYILDEANVRNADAVVAATGHDEDNLVVCLLGKIEYDVPLTVARINNPANDWLFGDAFGVDVKVSNTEIMTEVLKSVSVGDIVTRLRLRAENLVIDEFVVPQDAPVVGRTIAELSLPGCTQIVAIISGGRVVVPNGSTRLEVGDELLVVAQCEDEAQLRQLFGVKAPSRT
jgi:trk system potassium uptake protein TrkA